MVIVRTGAPDAHDQIGEFDRLDVVVELFHRVARW